jgi:LysM repeat protein
VSEEARRRAARIAAPLVFLLAVTVAVVLVRAGLRAPEDEPAPTAPPAAVATETVVVGEGDTLVSIAERQGTTVAELRRLNPGIDPVQLEPGQQVRVR